MPTDTGAVLVRPDHHVCWRTPTVPADPATALTAAIDVVLARR